MASVLSEFLNSFPNNSVTIQRATETLNDIGEKTLTWDNIYENIKCIFILKSQYGDENEFAQKDFAKAKYECRVELADIGENNDIASITNVNTKDRAVIGGKIYKILFVNGELGDTNLIDHCNLTLELLE